MNLRPVEPYFSLASAHVASSSLTPAIKCFNSTYQSTTKKINMLCCSHL